MTVYQLLFWSMALISIIVMGLITVSLLQLQRNASDSPNAPHNLHKNMGIEVLWAIVPVIILIGLLGWTYLTIS